MNKLIFRVILSIAVFFIAIVIFFAGFRIIPDGMMAVEIHAIGKNRVLPEPVKQGWHWRRPLMVEFETYNVREQEVNVSVEQAITKDLREVNVGANVYYQINPEKLVELHSKLGENYEVRRRIEVFTSSAIKDTVREFQRKDIFGQNRDQLSKRINAVLAENITPLGVDIHKVLVSHIYFPDRYTQQISSNYPSQITPVNVTKECLSKDQGYVKVNLKVYHYIKSEDAEFVHENLGTSYKEDHIISPVGNIVTNILAGYLLADIHKVATRQNVSQQVLKAIQEKLQDYKVNVKDVTVEEVRYSAEYQQKLNEIQITKKQLEKMEIEKEVQAKEAEIEQRKREHQNTLQEMEFAARKKREEELLKQENLAKISRAEAEAQAMLTLEKGKVEALLKVQDIVSKNPQVLQYLYVDKISDKVKVIVVPANGGNISVQDAIKAIKEQE